MKQSAGEVHFTVMLGPSREILVSSVVRMEP